MRAIATKYRSFVAEAEKNWNVLDRTLYALCDENPGHSDGAVARAKLWLIGRTFTTGIERKIRSGGSMGSSLTTLAELLVARASDVDSCFTALRKIREPLDAAKCKSIVSIHGQMLRLLRPVILRKQSPRSFVSKYMHFHNPVVPIFDSVAVTSLGKLLRWDDAMQVFEIAKGEDKIYGWYVMRFFRLYKQLGALGVRPTARRIDYYLSSSADT